MKKKDKLTILDRAAHTHKIIIIIRTVIVQAEIQKLTTEIYFTFDIKFGLLSYSTKNEFPVVLELNEHFCMSSSEEVSKELKKEKWHHRGSRYNSSWHNSFVLCELVFPQVDHYESLAKIYPTQTFKEVYIYIYIRERH